MGFHEIRGHEKNIRILARVIKTRRLPHAYLFAGIGGIGKRLTALALSKVLLCSSPDPEHCGSCADCIQVDHHNHPDFLTLEPKNNSIPIDSIRYLRQQLSWKSYRGKYKICIIDDAEKMTTQAQNALLKTLEEPPPHSLIILITPQPYRLLPTIASRCQRLNFEPLPISVVAELTMERRKIDEPAAYLTAHLSGGSLGKAMTLDIEYCKEMRDSWAGLSKVPSKGKGEELFRLAEGLSKERNDVELTLDFLRIWYRDVILYKIYERQDCLVLKDKAGEIAVHSSFWKMENLINAVSLIDEYHRALEYNVNPQLTLESLFLNLTSGSKCNVLH